MKWNRLTLEAANSVRITMLPEGRVSVELEDVSHDALPKHERDMVLDVRGAANMLQTTQRHVRSLMHKEKNPIPFYKLGRKVRFRETDIQEWMKSSPDNLARKFMKELKAA